MKLFLLEFREGFKNGFRNEKYSVNEFAHDQGYVIRAEDIRQARNMAFDVEEGPWWLDEAVTSCVYLSENGLPGILLKNEPTG